MLRYSPSALHAEDYELWSRMLLHTKGENLADVLLYYRLHPASVSKRYTDFQNEQGARISALAIRQHLPSLDLAWEESIALTSAIHGISRSAKLQRARLTSMYLKLWTEFCYVHNPDREGLKKLNQQVLAWAADFSVCLGEQADAAMREALARFLLEFAADAAVRDWAARAAPRSGKAPGP